MGTVQGGGRDQWPNGCSFPGQSDSLASADKFLSVVREALRGHAAEGCRPTPANLGGYEIIDELGQGTFGVVLLAWDPVLRCKRALKIPSARAMAEPAIRSDFLDEARHMAALDPHPNIVQVVAAVEAKTRDDVDCIVMEYCPAGSLAGWLKRRGGGRIEDVRAVARFVAEMADGVHLAHCQGRVHRDLKPGNVLMGLLSNRDPSRLDSFRPKVADFGLAARLGLDGSAGSLPGGAYAGTPAYMSPEQARGEQRQIGIRSDVYAMGAILYEMLAGQRLYPQASRTAVLGEILSDLPSPSLKGARPDAPRDLDAICRRAVSKDPYRRHTSASELADHLRRFASGEALPGSPIVTRAKSAMRKRPLVTITSATAAMALAMGSYSAWSKVRGDAETWLNGIRSADCSTLPDLAARKPAAWLVDASLGSQFNESDRDRKLAAAVMLAGQNPAAAEFAIDTLVETEASLVKPLALSLDRFVPSLERSLRDRMSEDSGPSAARDGEGRGRRRAGAALALAHLGRSGEIRPILRGGPNPEARSFLIHDMGPSGIPIGDILRWTGAEFDPQIRQALILALGETPEAAWGDELRSRATDQLLAIYAHDGDAAAHSAAKWILLGWSRSGRPHSPDLARRLAELDDALARETPDPAKSWRITRSGLTLVRLDIPAVDGDPARTIEVSDTEVTVENYSRYIEGHKNDAEISPHPECPANMISWVDAALFCERIGEIDGLDAGENCFERLDNGSFSPAAGYVSLRGYRLPTAGEFAFACRGGASSMRPYGEADSLLGKYSWYRSNSTHAQRVAGLKPNAFGLFDMLGNVAEWCHDPVRERGTLCQSLLGSSFMATAVGVRSDTPKTIRCGVNFAQPNYGFRVVRTVSIE